MKANPCPMCGCEHIEIQHIEKPYDDYLAFCPKCGFDFADRGLYGEWPEDAIELWNDELNSEVWQVLFYGKDI